LLGGTNSFAGQFLHPSLVQSSRSIQPMHSPMVPKKAFYLLPFLWDQVFASEIKKPRKRICWVEPTLLQVSSYTHLLYKAQDPFSACRQSNGFKTSFLSSTSFVGPSLCFTDRETQEENLLGGTNSFAGQFLHQSLVQSSRSIQRMQTVQWFQKKLSIFYLFCGTKSLLHRSRNSGREFAGWNQLFCRSVLTPISCTKLKIHSAHADSPMVPKKAFYLLPFLWDQVFASEIKKPRKRICWVEPILLLVSSYTHLLYKAQDPFSACRQSNGFKTSFLSSTSFVGPSLCFTDRETQEENLQGGTNSFIGQYLHQSYTKLKVHSVSFIIRITLCQCDSDVRPMLSAKLHVQKYPEMFLCDYIIGKYFPSSYCWLIVHINI